MVYIIYPFILFIVSLKISFSFQNDEKMTGAVGWQVMENLFVLPIATTYDIITTDECSLEIAIKCLLKAFSVPQCFSSIYEERSRSYKNDTTINSELFMNHLKDCSVAEIKKINFKNATLSRITHAFGGIYAHYAVYPFCKLNADTCFNAEKCIIPSQYNVLDRIINTCSDAAFSKLNLSFVPSKPSVTTYIDDLEELGTNKIGKILDSYASTLPSEIIETFGNLTYEEFDALKMIAATFPKLKQYLCDSKDGERLHGNLKFVDGQTSLPPTPQLPQNEKDLFKTFSAEIYDAVKAILAVHPHFRWSFCSPIFAISSSKELSNIFSPVVTEKAIINCKTMLFEKYYKRDKEM